MSKITMPEQSSPPSTPASGYSIVYPKSDGWYYQGSDGVEHKFGTSGSGGATALSDLSDVYISGSQSPGEALIWDGSKWMPGVVSTSGSDGAVVMATSPSTDYITKFISATNIGNSLLFDNGTNVGLGHAVPTGRLDIQGLAVNDLPTYSAEFLDDANWTLGAGWSGDFASGFTYTGGGGTATLTHDHAAVATTKYQIAYTVTGRTAGSFIVAFGGQSLAAITATGAWGPTATNTDALTITPTTDFNGTIVISIKSITTRSTALINIRNSAGTVVNEIRSGNSNTNTFFGTFTGGNVTTGLYNIGVGTYSLGKMTTGDGNIALGYYALGNLTTGINNFASGTNSQANNSLGSNNVSIGLNTLLSATGGYNTAVGSQSGHTLTTGTFNTFLGYFSGRNASQKVDAINSMALGNGAYTTADNQVVIGNTSVTSTVLHGSITLDEAGNLVLGTTTGTKIGTATSQKIGFFNATPVVQRSHIEDATDTTNVITRFNSLLLALEQLGLLASS